MKKFSSQLTKHINILTKYINFLAIFPVALSQCSSDLRFYKSKLWSNKRIFVQTILVKISDWTYRLKFTNTFFNFRLASRRRDAFRQGKIWPRWSISNGDFYRKCFACPFCVLPVYFSYFLRKSSHFRKMEKC